MPRVDSDIKLDFKDVLFRPKRSTLKSRSEVSDVRNGGEGVLYLRAYFCSRWVREQVNLQREFIFRNSKARYNGVPIIASNMDTVGTFEMATALAEVGYAAAWREEVA